MSKDKMQQKTPRLEEPAVSFDLSLLYILTSRQLPGGKISKAKEIGCTSVIHTYLQQYQIQ